MSRFQCEICLQTFGAKNNLKRHVKAMHPCASITVDNPCESVSTRDPIVYEEAVSLVGQEINDDCFSSLDMAEIDNNENDCNINAGNDRSVELLRTTPNNEDSLDDVPIETIHFDNSETIHQSSLHSSIIDLFALIHKHHLPPILFDEILKWYDDAQISGFSKSKNATSYEVTKKILSTELSEKTCGKPIQVEINCSSLNQIPNTILYKSTYLNPNSNNAPDRPQVYLGRIL